MILQRFYIDTPIGLLSAQIDEKSLHRLEFVEEKVVREENQSFTPLMLFIKQEINDYFAGKLKEFKTPISLSGTPFQLQAWQALTKVPYGQKQSYLSQAKEIARPKSFRAVANANACNKIVIIIPCHRIINHNGKLGGYSYGIERKIWLIEHENKYG